MPYHQPNKLKLNKGGTFYLRKFTHFWPLLVWFGVLYAAYWAYSQGVVFRRMNGAVDVYQENVSSPEDGNLLKLADKIERGTRVKEGDPVAYMSTTQIDAEIAAIKTEIEIERADRLLDFDKELLKLEAELRKIRVEIGGAEAEANANREAVKEIKDRIRNAMPHATPKELAAYQNVPNPEVAKYQAEIAKLEGQAKVWKVEEAKVQEALDKMRAQRKVLEDEKDVYKIAEHTQAVELMQLEAKRTQYTLRATKAGIVDRIIKEPGEYVKAGDGILKIVGDPSQIVGFLPEDQLSQVKEGTTVWITASHDRTAAYPTKVLFLAPRLNALPDSTSPLPNRMLHGRDIVVAYPPTAIVAGRTKDDPLTYLLLSGQTVTIHIEKPGTIPLINQIFPSSDAP